MMFFNWISCYGGRSVNRTQVFASLSGLHLRLSPPPRQVLFPQLIWFCIIMLIAAYKHFNLFTITFSFLTLCVTVVPRHATKDGRFDLQNTEGWSVRGRACAYSHNQRLSRFTFRLSCILSHSTSTIITCHSTKISVSQFFYPIK